MAKLKTPLRYPGGKSRAMKFLGQYFPDSIQGYVEPFLGGGSVALYVTQQYPNAYMHVNDAYYPLYCFWKTLQTEGKAMAMRLEDIKLSTGDDEEAQRDPLPTNVPFLDWCHHLFHDKHIMATSQSIQFENCQTIKC